MDLTQSMRQLQSLQEGASARLNPLSQMELMKLQQGMLGRSSSSVMELQVAHAQLAAQGSSQFQPSMMDLQAAQAQITAQNNALLGNGVNQLSGSAMLVGTVAALQEESGQLRSQWKSDVARLERELGQLRNAGGCALQQIAQAQGQSTLRIEPNLQALVLNGQGGAGPLQQEMAAQAMASQAMMLQNQQAVMQQSQQAMLQQSASDKEQQLLLARIADLERQRDQALLMGQMRSGASECSSQPYERQAPPDSMNLTDALFNQMRASNAGAGTSNAQSQPPLTARSSAQAPLTARGSSQAQKPLDFQDTLAGSVMVPPITMPSVSPEVAQMKSTQGEVYQELESMEVELRKVLEENSKMKEEKENRETAHQLDISTLEAMLAKVMDDNRQLEKALAETDSLLNVCVAKKVNPIRSFDDKIGDPIGHSFRSARSMAEPAIEPSIDGQSDRSSESYRPQRFSIAT